MTLLVHLTPFLTISYFHVYLYGIPDDLLRWIKNFFYKSNATDQGTELINLLSGVIQGSSRPIGFVMLLMYIDGLAELLEHYGIVDKLFADYAKSLFDNKK